MKNLENYQIQPLKNCELKNINGGVGILGPLVAVLALGGVAFSWGWELGREHARKHKEQAT